MSEIEFRTEFVEVDEAIIVPEDTTLADLSIYIGDDCLTLNRPRGRTRLAQPRENVFGPIAGLADWFIENWMAILWEMHTPFKKSVIGETASERSVLPGVREATSYWSEFLESARESLHTDGPEWAQKQKNDRDRFIEAQSRDNAEIAALADWQHRHLLGHVSSNLALPSVVLLPESRNIVVSVDRLPSDLDSSVEFLGPDKQSRTPSLFVVGKTAFRAAAHAFVDAVVERTQSAREFADWANWLDERWQTAQAEESDPKRRLRCMLGEVSASTIESLQQQRKGTLAQGLEQLLLDCPIVDRKSLLLPAQQIVSEYVSKDASSLSANEVAGWETVGQATISPEQPDFDQGWRLARVVRSRLNVGSKPIKSVEAILERLDVALQDRQETPLFRAAVCANREGRAHIVPSATDARMESPPAFRFAVASALGRLLWASRTKGAGPICAAQGDHAMLSQSRRANAFAAEFLLPSEAIEGLGPDDPELWKIGETYGISHSAAIWHACNVAARKAGTRS
jgi:hypothetical protein